MKNLLIAASLLALVACKKEESAPAPTTTEPAKTEPAASPTPAAEPAKTEPAKTEPAAGGAAAGEFGVAECDEYVSKMMKCLESDKYPAAAKDQAKQAFQQTKDAWKQAASTPEGKQGMATACKQAIDAMKQGGEAMCPGVW